MFTNFESKSWWGSLDKDIKELFSESIFLSEITPSLDKQFHDYSFIVFPAAKAYEGFLKKVFLERGFITKEDYSGKRFRIGKALNPSLDKRFKNESVYLKVVNFCGGNKLADKMWDTWKNCRNLLFHWFPNEKNAIDFDEANTRLTEIFDTVDEVYLGCKIR